jgi:GT2 family glycosyltransferase
MTTSTHPRVCIVIPNYNGWRDTIECLESVYRITYPNYDVIVVDNASQDESIQKIREYCAGQIKVVTQFVADVGEKAPIQLIEYATTERDTIVTYDHSANKQDGSANSLPCLRLILIKNDTNSGFTGANNIAVRYALETLNPRYILLLNNDTAVDSTFLDQLIKVAEMDSRIALVQSKLLNYDDLTIDYAGLICDVFGWPRARGRAERDTGQYDQLADSGFFCVCAACLLVSRDFLLELGNQCFDEHLFAYFEDVDLSWAARLFGHKIIYCPTSICYHKGSKTSRMPNPNTAFWGYKNRIRVLAKNYSFKTLAETLPTAMCLDLVWSIAYSVKDKDLTYITSFVKALAWNIINVRSALELRHYVQSHRQIDDSQIMNYMVHNSLQLDVLLRKMGIKT